MVSGSSQVYIIRDDGGLNGTFLTLGGGDWRMSHLLPDHRLSNEQFQTYPGITGGTGERLYTRAPAQIQANQAYCHFHSMVGIIQL